MSEDIRLKMSFKNHRKRRKANLLLGLQKSATDYILDLWISCAENHPTGELTGMDEVDIALEAGWEGDPHVFVEAMVAARLIERNGDGVYKIHGWEEHQPWVAHKEERSEMAKKAVNTRWERVRQGLSKTEGIRNVCDPHTERNTPSPIPSPNPFPKDKKATASPALLIDQLNETCKKINRLPKKAEKFNPHQWIQWAINHRYHPQAISKALDRLVAEWPGIGTPWAYASRIIKVESGNSYERDAAQVVKQEQNEWNDLLARMKAAYKGG